MVKLIYAGPNTIAVCGGRYYNNAAEAMMQRYRRMADKIVVVGTQKQVVESHDMELAGDDLEFVDVKKVNTLHSLMYERRENQRIISKLVADADLCVAHVPSFPGEMLANEARRQKKPCLNVVIGCSWDATWNYDWRGKLLAPFRFLALRKVQRQATHSIYVTEEFLQHRYPTKGKSIGCSDVKITSDPDMFKIRSAHIDAIGPRPLRIATCAGIDVPYKGQAYVIKALAKLKSRGIKMEYHIAGPGIGDSLRILANELGVADRVIFEGLLSHDKIESFLDDMDIYIQPSLLEGLPRALVEAMSRGLYCLGTEVGGMPELLSSSCLFGKGDVTGITKLLTNVNAKKLKEESDRNIKRAMDFNPERLNKMRNDFFEEFLKDSGLRKSNL